MAMIDYGVLAKKNGRIINEDEFLYAVEDAPETAIDIEDLEEEKIKGNYTVIGEDDFFVAIWKTAVFAVFLSNGATKSKFALRRIHSDGQQMEISLKSYNFAMWKSNNQYRIRFCVNKNWYDILYGYGVDSNYEAQLQCALSYGMTIREIEEISEFWSRSVIVSGIKRRKRKGKKTFNRDYKYKKLPIYFQMVIKYEDNEYNESMQIQKKYKKLDEALADFEKLPIDAREHLQKYSNNGYAAIFLYQYTVDYDTTFDFSSNHLNEKRLASREIINKGDEENYVFE